MTNTEIIAPKEKVSISLVLGALSLQITKDKEDRTPATKIMIYMESLLSSSPYLYSDKSIRSNRQSVMKKIKICFFIKYEVTLYNYQDYNLHYKHNELHYRNHGKTLGYTNYQHQVPSGAINILQHNSRYLLFCT